MAPSLTVLVSLHLTAVMHMSSSGKQRCLARRRSSGALLRLARQPMFANTCTCSQVIITILSKALCTTLSALLRPAQHNKSSTQKLCGNKDVQHCPLAVIHSNAAGSEIGDTFLGYRDHSTKHLTSSIPVCSWYGRAVGEEAGAEMDQVQQS